MLYIVFFLMVDKIFVFSAQNIDLEFLPVIAGHNLPDKSCVADTAMQIELA